MFLDHQIHLYVHFGANRQTKKSVGNDETIS